MKQRIDRGIKKRQKMTQQDIFKLSQVTKTTSQISSNTSGDVIDPSISGSKDTEGRKARFKFPPLVKPEAKTSMKTNEAPASGLHSI